MSGEAAVENTKHFGGYRIVEIVVMLVSVAASFHMVGAQTLKILSLRGLELAVEGFIKLHKNK